MLVKCLNLKILPVSRKASLGWMNQCAQAIFRAASYGPKFAGCTKILVKAAEIIKMTRICGEVTQS